METISFGNPLSTFIGFAFLLLAPIFIYYSMKSLINPQATSGGYLQNAGTKIPEFLSSSHVDRTRRVRKNYKRVLTKNYKRKNFSCKTSSENNGNAMDCQKQNLRHCSIGLNRFQLINKTHECLNSFKPKDRKKILHPCLTSGRGSLTGGKIDLKFQPTSLTTILEDVEY